MEIRQVGMVGCGLMGSGIAQVCARSGQQVVVREADGQLLASNTSSICIAELAGAAKRPAQVLGCGYPMGRPTLLDFVGIDTTYHIGNILFDEFKDSRYAAPALMKRMVLAGHHGRKTGKGFYDYSEK